MPTVPITKSLFTFLGELLPGQFSLFAIIYTKIHLLTIPFTLKEENHFLFMIDIQRYFNSEHKYVKIMLLVQILFDPEAFEDSNLRPHRPRFCSEMGLTCISVQTLKQTHI